jgi:Xaa-Pro aminopeptidase
VRCRDLYEQVRGWLATAPVGTWSSHLGHGIGLSPHEAPRLNPEWDDVLAEGDVIAVEPALYDPALACGIRIENDYVVTAQGLELLSPFPLGLAPD